MKDLYKHLGLEETASPDAVREALATRAAPGTPAESATRSAAEFVLLDPRRRAVYDRNRRVLVSIGQLRSRLGLNLKPFWSRGGFGDFSYAFDPTGGRAGAAAASHAPQDPLADPRMLWRAFGAGRRRGGSSAAGSVSRGPSRLGLWMAAGAVLALAAAALLIALHPWR